MDTQSNVLQVYRELADCYEARGEAALRDRFLVLAADAAWTAGQADEAERLRQRLLLRNRHHLLKPYHSFAQALRSGDVKLYLQELRKSHPPEAARELLERVRGQEDAPPPIEKTAAPGFPPTAGDLRIGDEPDATWMPDMSGQGPRAAGFDLEMTADLDATAALENLAARPERLERPQRNAPPPNPVPRGRPAAAAKPRSQPLPGTAASPSRPSAPPQRPEGPARNVPPAIGPIAPEAASAGARWIATFLGLLAIAAGLGLVGFLLARPFLNAAP